MPRRARIHYVSLRSSLVNLPISIYGPLLERGVVSSLQNTANPNLHSVLRLQRPQGLAIHLSIEADEKSRRPQNGGAIGANGEAYVGWTGMASASSLAQFQSGGSGEKGLETIEIDPQFAGSLGFAEGDTVGINHHSK